MKEILRKQVQIMVKNCNWPVPKITTELDPFTGNPNFGLTLSHLAEEDKKSYSRSFRGIVEFWG